MSRLELLRDRGLFALLVSETVSVTGSQMTWVALPWFVLTTTHSPGKMVLVLLSQSLGLILFFLIVVSGLVGGSWGRIDSVRWTPTQLRKLAATGVA